MRHPDRPTALSCVRCERPSCPECLREAAVGYQCVDCVRAGARDTRAARSVGVGGGSGTDKPLVVLGLIVVNTAIFLLTVVQAGSVMGNSGAGLFELWSLQPLAVAGGQWWRLLTTGFLHYGPLHLAFNMLALYIIGRDLELALGRGKFLLVYLVSLLGGATSSFVFSGLRDETAGASGAVFGLMAGAAVLLHRLGRSPRPALTLIGINLALTLVIPGISLSGHLGGLVIGAAVTAALVYAPRARQTLWQVGGIAGLVVVLGLVLVVRAASLSSLVG